MIGSIQMTEAFPEVTDQVVDALHRFVPLANAMLKAGRRTPSVSIVSHSCFARKRDGQVGGDALGGLRICAPMVKDIVLLPVWY
jgi:hypothetical protein